MKFDKAYLGCRIDAELELGLLAVVDGEPLHEEGGEPGSSSSTEGVEDKESLESSALVSQLPDPVQHKVDNLLSDGVVAPGVVVGGVLLASHQLLGVEQLTVGSSTDLVNNSRLKINEHGPIKYNISKMFLRAQ